MEMGKTVFIVASYSVNSSIRQTLDSIDLAWMHWAKESYTLILSDSSPNVGPVETARQWAKDRNCELVIDHSDTRRIQKLALNAAFSARQIEDSDVIIAVNDDVILEKSSVTHLMRALRSNPEVVFAVGSTLPDPNFSRHGRRAGAWQLQASNRLARQLPRSAARSEGALWATRGTFARKYRWPIGGGSELDDVEIARYVVSNGLPALNVHEAVAFKIPPKGFLEFSAQTRRSDASDVSDFAASVSFFLRCKTIFACSFANPLGALIYGMYRIRMLALNPSKAAEIGEYWERSPSTLRHGSEDA